MLMFSVNFGPKKYNWMLPIEFAEAASKEEFKNCALIEKPTVLKKLDVKVALMPGILVIRPSPSQPQAPRKSPP